jgi:putative ABC transport system permease protein
MFSTGVEVWEEMLDNQALLSSQYDVIAGAWPENYNEIVLIIDENNEISDMALYALGLRDMIEVQKIMEAAMMGETYETKASIYTYEDLLFMRFKLVLPADYYKESEDGSWSDIREDRTEEGKEEYIINYTDIVGLMMPSISSIINVISYVLISFVAISLVVSSIMIGIITYISVLERTKEIGILRSVGASKRDISRVFNAETLIVGFVSGALGIIITILLTFPANSIIRNLTGISGVKALLPMKSGIVLVIISMILTLIAGLIPSRLAAKKDPVVALRSE